MQAVVNAVKTKKLPTIVVVLMVVVSMCGYVGNSLRIIGIGFPLDDAWIHQVYARNLAIDKIWAFLPGQVSAGSTSPLWTVILSVGYLLKLMPYIWTFTVGFLCLVGLCITGQKISQAETGQPPKWHLLALFLAFEWHMVWAALSGMETIFYALLILVFFYLEYDALPKPILTGLLVGMAVWVRPDGITLLGPALMVCILSAKNWKSTLVEIFKILAGFAIAFVPYILFNNFMHGSLWPNTYYAKQAEYYSLLRGPLLLRWSRLMGLPLIGAGVLLLPGFIWMIWQSLKEKKWVLLSMGIWWLGYSLIYALRLPVVYQHGRYLIPAMPVFFVVGFIGIREIIAHWVVRNKVTKILSQAWAISILVVEILFFGLGAQAYAEDVAIIETEMVATARWLNSNTPENAVIAVHDIGAVGYFTDRKLIDLAGLISPEVIPFIRDEARLEGFLNRQGIDFLVTFPGWYPQMTKNKVSVFRTGGPFSPAAGGENMEVYRW